MPKCQIQRGKVFGYIAGIWLAFFLIGLMCWKIKYKASTEQVVFYYIGIFGAILFTMVAIIPGKQPKHVCPLCKTKFATDLDFNEHRSSCAAENQSRLSSLPPHSQLHCLQCQQPLRLWPKHFQPLSFHCSNESCPVGPGRVSIINTGQNCYHCFQCNYFRCLVCADNDVNGCPDRQSSNQQQELPPVHKAPPPVLEDPPPSYDEAMKMV